MRRTVHEVRGAYALGVISSDDPEHLVFARNGASPLVLGIGDGEMYVASDTPAILPYTRREIILQEGEIAVVGRDGFRLTDYAGARIEREPDRRSPGMRARRRRAASSTSCSRRSSSSPT